MPRNIRVVRRLGMVASPTPIAPISWESIVAYRACIRLSPEVGEAYWSLANLKTFRFSDEDIDAMRRIEHRHDPRINVFESVRQVRTLSHGFFEQRGDSGCPSPDPIFIVGLPRAGSTLLEQILASHSQVEGTSELTDIIAIAQKLGGKSRKNPSGNYPESLSELSLDPFRELGEGYLESTRIQRSDTPFFYRQNAE